MESLSRSGLTGNARLPLVGRRPGESPRDEDATARGNALSALTAPSARRPGAGQSLTPGLLPSTRTHSPPAGGPTRQLPAAWTGCRRCAATPKSPGTPQGTGWGRSGVGGTIWWLPAALHPGSLSSPQTPCRPCTHAHSHPPAFSLSLSPATTDLPRERQLLQRLQCARFSLQHRGEYPSVTSTRRLGGSGPRLLEEDPPWWPQTSPSGPRAACSWNRTVESQHSVARPFQIIPTIPSRPRWTIRCWATRTWLPFPRTRPSWTSKGLTS